MKNIGKVIGLYPMPTTVVGTEIEGKINWMNVAHVGIWGLEGMLLSIGKRHYTTKGLHENRTVSINMVDEPMMVKADYVGIVSGRTTDKSGVFETFSGALHHAPLIKDAPIAMEGRITEIFENETHCMYVVIPENTYVREDVLDERGKIDFPKIKPLLFEMPYRRYIKSGEVAGQAWSIGKGYQNG